METVHRPPKKLNVGLSYQEVRTRTEEICRPLSPEDHVAQPVSFVSPPKWHLAHSTWFFETFMLGRFLPDYKVFHDRYAYLFNSYYNTHGERTKRDHRGGMTRPTVDEVLAYRSYVDDHMDALLKDQQDNKELRSLLDIGLHHEQQHQELLWTDIKYILGNNPLFPPYDQEFKTDQGHTRDLGWEDCKEGLFEIGHNGQGFGFDNEFGRHRVFLEPYRIHRSLVSNGEYLSFIADGGYERHELWLDEGWAWLQESGVNHPLHWHLIGGQWHSYQLSGLEVLNREQALCHVSHYEAAAFAAWKGLRLPTEAEWEVASLNFGWGERWEHTNSAYLAYPGFKRADGAVGEYNGKFMMNQMVQRGASYVTSPGHARATYRNFFHPTMRWQFSGIRLASDA